MAGTEREGCMTVAWNEPYVFCAVSAGMRYLEAFMLAVTLAAALSFPSHHVVIHTKKRENQASDTVFR